MSKMSVKSKISAILCTVFMAAGLFSACTPSTSTPDNTQTSSPGNTQQSSSATPVAETPDPTNAEPETVYLFSNFGTYQNYATGSTTEAFNLVQSYILEQTGIEVIPILPTKGSESEKLNLLLAGGDPLDIFYASDGWNFYAQNDAIISMTDLLDEYGQSILSVIPYDSDWAGAWGALTDTDGNVWAIPQVPALVGNPVYVRSDWLENLNMDMPTDFETLENLLAELQQADPAGSDQTIPLVCSLSGLEGALASGFMDVAVGPFVDTDGRVKPKVFNSGYKQFITLMADWYQKGYIYKESFTASADIIRDLVSKNRVGVAAVWYTWVTSRAYELSQVVPEAEYKVAEIQGPMGNTVTASDVGSSGTVIASKSQNPEAAMRLLNWALTDLDNYLTCVFGIQGQNWEWVDANDPYDVQRLNEDYSAEFVCVPTFANTILYKMVDPTLAPQWDYMLNYITDLSRAKLPYNYGFGAKYDKDAISNEAPQAVDLDTMISENVVKFIMGERPISEYDQFLEELESVGLEEWITAYTKQYNENKS